MPRSPRQSAIAQILIDRIRGRAPMPAQGIQALFAGAREMSIRWQGIQVLFAGGREMSILLSMTTDVDRALAAMVQVIRAAPAPGMRLEMDLAMVESSENLCGALQRWMW
jgi:hypothetical protein